MVQFIKDVEQEENFSQYPEKVDKYFQDRQMTISTFLKGMSGMAEEEFPPIRITSAKQYADFLDSEIEFWNEKDKDKKLKSIVRYDRLVTAQQQFKQAMNYVDSGSNFDYQMGHSVNSLGEGILYSKTKLAQAFLKYIGESKTFLEGFRACLLDDKNISLPSNIDTWRGFYAALAFRESFFQYVSLSTDVLSGIQHGAELASSNFAELNQAYVQAFHEQQTRIAQITEQTNAHLTGLDERSMRQFEEANTRLVEMEMVYREKLKLEEPAKYWKDIAGEYEKKGTKWLLISGGLALHIVAGLILFLVFMPALFSDDYHWFDNLKNSAIITVIASIAIYMLRLTVKMATSSYHLSRDARERNNLSYFYLALIEKNAVSDKERALILNALFSRSDTGLLKGEAAPSMPTNLSDIVGFLENK